MIYVEKQWQSLPDWNQKYTYRYLTNNSDENEKAKGTKMFFIKQKFWFEE